MVDRHPYLVDEHGEPLWLTDGGELLSIHQSLSRWEQAL